MSGPTGAMTVVLIPIVATHGADGVLVVGVLAGLMLLLLAVTGAGRVMKYMPLPVVEGFTAGIAVIIGLQQLPAALGVEVEGEKVLGLAWNAITAWLGAPAWQAPVMTLAVATGIVVAARVRSGFPQRWCWWLLRRPSTCWQTAGSRPSVTSRRRCLLRAGRRSRGSTWIRCC